MDAIVTIQILDGKKAVYSTETAVEIHPTIAAEITTYPDTAACWILGQARENVHNDGAAFVPAKSTSKKAGE